MKLFGKNKLILLIKYIIYVHLIVNEELISLAGKSNSKYLTSFLENFRS
jgi:hypothetical protein